MFYKFLTIIFILFYPAGLFADWSAEDRFLNEFKHLQYIILGKVVALKKGPKDNSLISHAVKVEIVKKWVGPEEKTVEFLLRNYGGDEFEPKDPSTDRVPRIGETYLYYISKNDKGLKATMSAIPTFPPTRQILDLYDKMVKAKNQEDLVRITRKEVKKIYKIEMAKCKKEKFQSSRDACAEGVSHIWLVTDKAK